MSAAQLLTHFDRISEVPHAIPWLRGGSFLTSR